MDKKSKPVSVDKQKYVKLAQEIQKIVANEQTTQNAK